jgi:hypothetical protein
MAREDAGWDTAMVIRALTVLPMAALPEHADGRLWVPVEAGDADAAAISLPPARLAALVDAGVLELQERERDGRRERLWRLSWPVLKAVRAARRAIGQDVGIDEREEDPS